MLSIYYAPFLPNYLDSLALHPAAHVWSLQKVNQDNT